MSSKKDQHKAGIPEQPRGQEMGRGEDRDQNRDEMEDTPALRGRRTEANEFFADKSSQHTGSDPSTPRDNTPSLPAAIPNNTPLGESGGEKEFKERQKGK